MQGWHLSLGQDVALKQYAGMGRRTSDLLAVNRKFGSHLLCPRLLSKGEGVGWGASAPGRRTAFVSMLLLQVDSIVDASAFHVNAPFLGALHHHSALSFEQAQLSFDITG